MGEKQTEFSTIICLLL